MLSPGLAKPHAFQVISLILGLATPLYYEDIV
jgi:hypothetical protein